MHAKLNSGDRMGIENGIAGVGHTRQRLASSCVCCGSADLAVSPAILMPFIADRAFGWRPVVIDDSWGLNTIQSGNAYSICKTMRCRRCEHLFCDIRFSEEEMENIYTGYREEAYVRLREFYEPGYRGRNDALTVAVSYKQQIEEFLSPFVSDPLTILDWGGDTGVNTPFEKRRANLDIFDISGKAVGGDARVVTREQATSSKYGLIVCSQILEHIPCPSDVLLTVRQAMDAESILYIEVPFEEVMRMDLKDREKVKRHWHEHINFYSMQSLQSLLHNCSLKILANNVLVTEVGGAAVHILQVACRLA